jgi:hypothetical protein
MILCVNGPLSVGCEMQSGYPLPCIRCVVERMYNINADDSDRAV